MKALLSILGILISLQNPAQETRPQAQQIEKEEDRCCCSTYETEQCLFKVEKSVDAELNRLYRKVVKDWGPKDAAILRKAERFWIEYRDANCEAETATYEGGSIAPSISGSCRIRLTRQRIEEIKSIYFQSH